MFIKPEHIPLVFADQKQIYAMVTHGVLLSRCIEYRRAYVASVEAIQKWVQETFGKQLPISYPMPRKSTFGVKFVDDFEKIPDGWNKPNKYGVSYPNRKLVKELAGKLPEMPSTYAVYDGIIPLSLHYEDGATSYGMTSISGGVLSPFVDWYTNTERQVYYFLKVPNVPLYIAEIPAQHKQYNPESDAKITGPVS